ncbi:MAG: AsmA family protein [Terriglobales bacterium]
MKALKIIGIIIGILVVVVVALPFVINVNDFRPRIETEISSAIGREVKIGNLKLSILSGGVSADDLSIADDPAFSTTPFVRAKTLVVGVQIIPLIFSKSLQITNISLVEPQVILLRSPSGKWNFSTLGNKSATKPSESSNPNLSVGKLSVKDGSLSMGTANSSAKPTVYQNVNVSVENFSMTSQFPFTLSATLPGNGTLKLDGKAGPINAMDAATTPVQAQLAIKGLDLAASGFVPPASGISGVADFDATLDSDGHEVKSSGTMQGNNLKLSPKGRPAGRAVDVKYTANYELQPQTGELTSADASVGKAVARITGSFDLKGEPPALNMRINADGMPVDDLETLLPALGVTLPSGSSLQGGTLSANFTVSGPLDKLVIAGPVKLSNTKLAGFNFASKLSEVSKLSGAPQGQDTLIQNFSTDVHMSPAGTTTDNINLNVPSFGVITGNGTVSPSNALNYKMNASLTGGMVAGLTQLAGMGGKGATLPFMIEGTSSSPRFVPDIQGMMRSQLKSRLGGLTGQQVGGQNAGSVINSIGGLFGKKKKPPQ